MTVTTVPAVPSAASAPGAATRQRLFFADHIRVALTGQVIVHHLAIALAITIPGLWYFEIPNASDKAAQLVGLLLILFNQGFFMGTFFLIAGHFTPASYDRKGAGGFLRDRVVRLLIPLFAFVLLLGPIATIPELIAFHVRPSLDVYLAIARPGPLWFVEVLFLFSCAYALIRLWRRSAPPEPRPDAEPPSAVAVVLFTLALAAVTFAFRMAVPVGYTLPVLFLPTPAYLPQYASLFAAGVIAARRGWFRTIPDRLGWLGLTFAGVATMVLFLPALLESTAQAPFSGGLHLQAAAYALWDSIMGVGMSLGLIVVFRRWLNRAGRLWNELSRNAYTVYVIHPLLLVAVTLALTAAHLEPLLALLIAIAVAIPLCFAVAGLVRRLPGAARVL
jgi:fucose 4-O-acetylase-like acetyltransferase